MELANPADAGTAEKWAASLSPEEYAAAKYGAYAVGAWVLPSIKSSYRLVEYHPGNLEVDEVYRQYLGDGLLWVLTLDRILSAGGYNRLLVFNGRLTFENISLELARLRGVDVYTHERGWVGDRIKIGRNALPGSLAACGQAWERWRDIPLTRVQIEAVANYQCRRELGDESVIGWRAFAKRDFVPPRKIRARLDIAPGKAVWALFPSSTDELSADPEYSASSLEQYAWMENVIAALERHPRVHLVIRMHPNMAAERFDGRNSEYDLKWFSRLKNDEKYRSRLSVIDAADKCSTYDLMDAATVGLAYVSTCGLEMALRGKVACCGVRSNLNLIDRISLLKTFDDMRECFARHAVLPEGHADAAVQRQAFRLLHMLLNKLTIPFPLVKIHGWNLGASLNYASSGELAPGENAELDWICQCVADGTAPEYAPTDADRALSADGEDAMFSGVLDINEIGMRMGYENKSLDLSKNRRLNFSCDHDDLEACFVNLPHVRKYRYMSGDKAQMFFSSGNEPPPDRLCLLYYAPKSLHVELSLNHRPFATLAGSGWVESATLKIPDGYLREFNLLSFKAESSSQSRDESCGEKNGVFRLYKMDFLSVGHGKITSFISAANDFLYSSRLNISMLNRKMRGRPL
ncbi:MAG: hypothetical protein LBU23_03230 [Planctomycetota bacterium]|nr:hypothetical protein [Planctomycetota bacterium]